MNQFVNAVVGVLFTVTGGLATDVDARPSERGYTVHRDQGRYHSPSRHHSVHPDAYRQADVINRQRDALNRERQAMHRYYDGLMRELDARNREIDRWQQSQHHRHQDHRHQDHNYIADLANQKRAALNRDRDRLNRERDRMNREFDHRNAQLDRTQHSRRPW